MGRILGSPGYMRFTAEKLDSDAEEVAAIATALTEIIQKLDEEDSLKRHGYPTKIDEVKRRMDFTSEMLEKCAGIIRQAADLYDLSERKVLTRYEGKELGADDPIVIGSEKDWVDRWCGDVSGSVLCSLVSDRADLIDTEYFGYSSEYGLLELEGDGVAEAKNRVADLGIRDELTLGRIGTEARVGSKDNNIHFRKTGKAGHVMANADGSLSFQKGNAGAGGQLSAGANLVEAEQTVGITIGGDEYNLSAGAGLGMTLYGEAELNPADGRDPAIGIGFGPFSFRVSKKPKSKR